MTKEEPVTDTREPQYFGSFGPAGISSVTHSGYRCEQRVIPLGGLRSIMAVMGMRIFYGRLRDHSGVVQLAMTSNAFGAAEHKARALCDLLFEGALSGDTYEVYGTALPVIGKVDLTPTDTTILALRWRQAMGL